MIDWLRSSEEEILDREEHSARGLRILDDLDRFNRRMGWYRFHVRMVETHWRALGSPRPFRVLDIGTGPGGLLHHLLDSGLPVEAIGIDRSPSYVNMAQERIGPRARIEVADATAIPFADGAFDLATCTLMLHHLPRPVREAMIAEVRRTCRSAYFFDLEVTLHGAFGAPFLGLALGLGLDAIHDGALSVRRAATYAEFADLMRPLNVKARRVFPSALYTGPA